MMAKVIPMSTKPTSPATINPLEGRVKSKRGVGRPSKIDRDAAVFMAKKWRMVCVGDSATEADAWIVQHWKEITPDGQRIGITEPSHVRAAVRRVAKSWVSNCHFSFNDSAQVKEDAFSVVDHEAFAWRDISEIGTNFEVEGCAVLALESRAYPYESFVDGSPRAAMWMKGMRTARLCRTVPVASDEASQSVGPSIEERKGMTQIAAAVAQYVGILELRVIRRLHYGRRKLVAAQARN